MNANKNVVGKKRLGKDVAIFQAGNSNFDVFWGQGFTRHARFKKGVQGKVVTMAQVSGDSVPEYVYPQINEVL